MGIVKIMLAGCRVLSALGLVTHCYCRCGFGVNEDVDTDWEDIWQYGGTKTEDTVAQTCYVASSNNSDTEKVKICGLDADWNCQTETVDLTGQTPVEIPGTWIRIEGLEHADESSTALLGDITVTMATNFTLGVADNANEVRAYAPAIDQRCCGIHISVPAGYVALIANSILSAGNTATDKTRIDFKMRARKFGGVYQTRRQISLQANGASTFRHEHVILVAIDEKTDIKAIAKGSGNNSFASCQLEYYLIKRGLLGSYIDWRS